MLLSKGNAKLGEIPNISLPPIVTCKGCEDICGKSCYANRFYKMRPSVRKVWNANLEHLQRDMEGFFADLYKELSSKITYKYFRFHTGGDLINGVHFQYILGLASRLPDIRFLLFTKQFKVVNEALHPDLPVPENLQIVFSAWSGLEMDNPRKFRIAWMDDDKEDRIPDDAMLCHGLCHTCGICWGLDKIGKDVVFKKH